MLFRSAPAPAPPRTSPSNQRRENCHQPEQNAAGLRAAGRCGFEIEEVENSEAFEGAAARHGVVPGLVARGAPASTLRQIQNRADAGAIELVGEFLKCSLRDHFQSKVAGARLSRPREVRAPRPSRSTRTRRLLYRAHSRRGLRPTHAPRPPPLLHDGARVRHGVRRGPRPGFAPAIDILRVTGNLAAADATRAKHKLTRIVQMLVGLRRSR